LRYLSNQQFPGEHDLPHRVFPADLPSCNLKLALQGYCPVALLESAVRIPRVWGPPLACRVVCCVTDWTFRCSSHGIVVC
jgi:hypothetical protein